TMLQQSIELQQKLVEQFPDDRGDQNLLGGMYNNLGIALEQFGELQAAAGAFEQAIAHQELAMGGGTEPARARDHLRTHYVNAGRVRRQLGQIDAAVAAALARRELDAGDARQLFGIAEELATLYIYVGDAPDTEITKEACGKL